MPSIYNDYEKLHLMNFNFLLISILKIWITILYSIDSKEVDRLAEKIDMYDLYLDTVAALQNELINDNIFKKIFYIKFIFKIIELYKYQCLDCELKSKFLFYKFPNTFKVSSELEENRAPEFINSNNILLEEEKVFYHSEVFSNLIKTKLNKCTLDDCLLKDINFNNKHIKQINYTESFDLIKSILYLKLKIPELQESYKTFIARQEEVFNNTCLACMEN